MLATAEICYSPFYRTGLVLILPFLVSGLGLLPPMITSNQEPLCPGYPEGHRAEEKGIVWIIKLKSLYWGKWILTSNGYLMAKGSPFKDHLLPGGEGCRHLYLWSYLESMESLDPSFSNKIPPQEKKKKTQAGQTSAKPQPNLVILMPSSLKCLPS